jgi:hypothetical protein
MTARERGSKSPSFIAERSIGFEDLPAIVVTTLPAYPVGELGLVALRTLAQRWDPGPVVRPA